MKEIGQIIVRVSAPEKTCLDELGEYLLVQHVWDKINQAYFNLPPGVVVEAASIRLERK